MTGASVGVCAWARLAQALENSKARVRTLSRVRSDPWANGTEGRKGAACTAHACAETEKMDIKKP